MSYGFNVEEHELQTLSLPDGTYTVMVTEEWETKDDGEQRLVLIYEVLEGEQKGKTMKQWLSLFSDNPKAVGAARDNLKRVEGATGEPIKNSGDLNGRVLRIAIAPQKKNPQYKEITSYLPEDGDAI